MYLRVPINHFVPSNTVSYRTHISWLASDNNNGAIRPSPRREMVASPVDVHGARRPPPKDEERQKGNNSPCRVAAADQHNALHRVPYPTRVLRRRVLRVAAGRVPVVRVDAALSAERVPAVGPEVRPVAFGRRTAAADPVHSQRADHTGQAAGQSGRTVPSAPGGQLFRLLHRQRPTQLQPVLLVLSRAGNLYCTTAVVTPRDTVVIIVTTTVR